MVMLEVFPTGEGKIIEIKKNYTLVEIQGNRIYIPTKIIRAAMEQEKLELTERIGEDNGPTITCK